MMKVTAIPYYLSSIGTLLAYSSWWKAPLVLFGKEVRFQISDQEFFVNNLMDIWTLKEVIVDKCYQQFVQIKSQDIVIDIGGSIGDFSIAAEKKYLAQQVYTYELDPDRIALFKKNLKLHHCSKVNLYEHAAISLDDIFKETKVDHCDFMKVDCEGGEYPIFSKVSAKTLNKIKYIAFEVHFFTPEMKKNYQALKKTLEQNKFSLTQVANPVHDTIGFLYAKHN